MPTLLQDPKKYCENPPKTYTGEAFIKMVLAKVFLIYALRLRL
jgi:hypothetical protein